MAVGAAQSLAAGGNAGECSRGGEAPSASGSGLAALRLQAQAGQGAAEQDGGAGDGNL